MLIITLQYFVRRRHLVVVVVELSDGGHTRVNPGLWKACLNSHSTPLPAVLLISRPLKK
jgi:hypothetical protein